MWRSCRGVALDVKETMTIELVYQCQSMLFVVVRDLDWPRLGSKSTHPKSDLNSKSKFCLSQAFPPDLET